MSAVVKACCAAEVPTVTLPVVSDDDGLAVKLVPLLVSAEEIIIIFFY
jgi:hypothetical protein